MAGSLIERALGLLELLASDARGLPLQQLADRLDIPKSAAHRMLAELIRLGYVRQDDDTSRYRLSTRLAALGFRFLASSGVVDLVQPVLDGLARETGELVRLGVIEGDRQTWIAKSQGARRTCPTPARRPSCSAEPSGPAPVLSRHRRSNSERFLACHGARMQRAFPHFHGGPGGAAVSKRSCAGPTPRSNNLLR